MAIPGFTSQKTNVQTNAEQQFSFNPNINVQYGGGGVTAAPYGPQSSSTSQEASQSTRFDPSSLLTPQGIAPALLGAVAGAGGEVPAPAFSTGGSAFVPSMSSGFDMKSVLLLGGIGAVIYFVWKPFG